MQNSILNLRVFELLRFTETHQRHTGALALATGEHFNVFKILRIGHLEVKTHSPILGELLNPKGHHGQGVKFLRLFLTQFGIQDFDTESKTAKMDLEYYIGPNTEKSGGRIDIMVKDGKRSTLIIENKIYAGDQEKQMSRYRNFDCAAHLFYLTLDGHEPSNLSELAPNGIQCKCICYAKDILTWLNECRKEAACLPSVRETITQYIHLIKELTNQSITTSMNTDLIAEITKSEETYAAFDMLCEQFWPVRDALIGQFDLQINEIAKAIGLERKDSMRELVRKKGDFYFTTPGLIKCNLQIGCGFENNYFGDFYFGFARIDHKQQHPGEVHILPAFRKQFSQFPPEDPSDYWPAWAYWEEPYRHWTRIAYEAIISRQLGMNLKEKLEKMAKIARDICPD